MAILYLLPFLIVLMLVGTWLDYRGAFRAPTSMSESVKRSCLMALLFGAWIVGSEWIKGSLAQTGWMALALVLAIFFFPVGSDWLKLRRNGELGGE